jgi:hypothetical protein
VKATTLARLERAETLVRAITAGPDQTMADDPISLSRAAGIDPDPWQADLLCSDERRIMLNCSRQSGKSTTAATLAVHTSIYRPGSLVILLAPALRQSSELFKKSAGVYRDLGRPVPVASETALTLTLANGSRLVALPGTEATVRGFSGAGLLIVDEASRVPDALYYAVRPMLAVSGGRLILMSTPFGKRGFFFHEWTTGGPSWRRFKVPATQCPRISPEFLAEERDAMPAARFDEEYMCQFGDAEGAVWGYELIQAALDPEVTPLWTA